MFERFTERARQAIVLAQDESRMLRHSYIGTEHLLLGLLREEEGLAARALDALGITMDEMRSQVARIVGEGDEAMGGNVPFTPRAKKVLELALKEAMSLDHNYIGTEHILLGLVRENEGVGARILLDYDADAEKIRAEIHSLMGGGTARTTFPGDPGAHRPTRITVYCPRCDAPIESVGTAMTSGRFAVEGDGARPCERCGAVWQLSYRVEWTMTAEERG